MRLAWKTHGVYFCIRRRAQVQCMESSTLTHQDTPKYLVAAHSAGIIHGVH